MLLLTSATIPVRLRWKSPSIFPPWPRTECYPLKIVMILEVCTINRYELEQQKLFVINQINSTLLFLLLLWAITTLNDVCISSHVEIQTLQLKVSYVFIVWLEINNNNEWFCGTIKSFSSSNRYGLKLKVVHENTLHNTILTQSLQAEANAFTIRQYQILITEDRPHGLIHNALFAALFAHCNIFLSLQLIKMESYNIIKCLPRAET